ncbi:MAG: triose-phosphate isomerase, partial [Alphaproteobacteria bacterium]
MKKLICANWEMNLGRQDALMLVQELSENLAENQKKALIVIHPSFLHIPEISEALAGTKISVGAQNCSAFEKGSHTGEVGAKQLAEYNLSTVIVGHSERRKLFENNQIIKLKAEQSQKVGLTPIVCIGETSEEKSNGKTNSVLEKQLKESCPNSGNYVIVYEPLWAIGTGKSASLSEIEKVISFIKTIKKDIPVLYGGSVKPSNAGEILALENLDGVLVGGASLKADSFTKIIKSV